MLCPPVMSQLVFDSVSASPAAKQGHVLAATPSSYDHNTSLYPLALPPQPHMPLSRDSFSTPSSSTPCSLPAVRSWHQINPSSSSSAPLSVSTSTPNQSLILDSLTASKVTMVENLVDTAALIIESIWPSPSGAQYTSKAPVIPLHIFVKETLRRSRTTLSTLQLALYYIYKVRNQVLAAQEKIRQDQIQQLQQRAMQHLPLSPNGSVDTFSEEEFKQRDYFNSISLHIPPSAKNTPPLTPPGASSTPASLSPLSLSTPTPTSPILAKSEPVGCGRRMFLAALILASKFQQDRTYSNKAWSKISGLPVSEINLNEITFLSLIEYRLFVSQSVFQKWVTILTEKGRIRDRAALGRSSVQVQASEPQPVRRNSIQYCNNTLPSRMTCVTASSLEHQTQQPKQHLQNHQPAPQLASLALFTGEHAKRSNSAPVLDQGSSFQFDFVSAGASTMPKLAVDSAAARSIGDLVKYDSAPRGQQGMGSYLTHRWVQAQRREFLRSRMQAMGFAFTESPRASPQLGAAPSPATVDSQQQIKAGVILNNFVNNNILTYSQSRSLSMDQIQQRLDTTTTLAPVLSAINTNALVESKHSTLPSPVSSVSPNALAGSKRRVSDLDESSDANEMRSQSRRRLSVSFLVDC